MAVAVSKKYAYWLLNPKLSGQSNNATIIHPGYRLEPHFYKMIDIMQGHNTGNVNDDAQSY